MAWRSKPAGGSGTTTPNAVWATVVDALGPSAGGRPVASTTRRASTVRRPSTSTRLPQREVLDARDPADADVEPVGEVGAQRGVVDDGVGPRQVVVPVALDDGPRRDVAEAVVGEVDLVAPHAVRRRPRPTVDR